MALERSDEYAARGGAAWGPADRGSQPLDKNDSELYLSHPRGVRVLGP
jgi:hypothetical protein